MEKSQSINSHLCNMYHPSTPFLSYLWKKKPISLLDMMYSRMTNYKRYVVFFMCNIIFALAIHVPILIMILDMHPHKRAKIIHSWFLNLVIFMPRWNLGIYILGHMTQVITALHWDLVNLSTKLGAGNTIKAPSVGWIAC